MQEIKHQTIKDLRKDERPRERLMQFGAGALSDAELIAIIFSTGTKNYTAIDLGKKVLNLFDRDLSALINVDVNELCRDPELCGIGPGKACKLVAAIELGRRTHYRDREVLLIGNSPKKVANYLMEEMRYLKQEVFKVLLLDSKLKIFKEETISKGTVNASLVHPREVFNQAIRQHAVSIILAHNHPSGDPSPSTEDRQVTKRLKEAGELLGIQVIDHIIIGDNSYVSFQETGLL